MRPAMTSCLLAVALTGCATVKVDSAPAGAAIYLDDQPTGQVTPHSFAYSDLGPTGMHAIRVEKPGYEPSETVPVSTRVSGARITWSILLPVPVLIVNLVRGPGPSFKAAQPAHVQFLLRRPGEAPVPSAPVESE